jgi:hypothetical protein
MTHFEGQIKELSKLIKNWNLIEWASADTFNDFSQKLLTRLYEGKDALNIKRIIESELCATFGLYNTEFDADVLSHEIMLWWNNHN